MTTLEPTDVRHAVEATWQPAIVGGVPAFPEGVQVARPFVADVSAVMPSIERILSSRMLTNGPFVRALEERVADYVGARHCIAVSSCTSGLMLLFAATSLAGDVIVPSFTFAATAHAVAWNALRPVFADVARDTLTLDPGSATKSVGVRTAAIMATHVYGTPAAVDELAALTAENGIRLFFDGAHALGSLYRGVPLGGLGDATVFSLSPTKVLTSCEGGIIATDDDEIAELCRMGRDYGNPGDYDCRFVGLNARLSEINAAVALKAFDSLEERIERRNVLASSYMSELGGIPGISFPEVPIGSRSTYKDFTIVVEPEQFGLTASQLAESLAADGVQSKRYYSPPVHRMRSYRHLPPAQVPLPNTEWAASRVLSIPLWEEMPDGLVEAVARVIRATQAFAPVIRALTDRQARAARQARVG